MYAVLFWCQNKCKVSVNVNSVPRKQLFVQTSHNEDMAAVFVFNPVFLNMFLVLISLA